ncbi:MAG: P1 family peptidase [Acidobacteria bacterium]|nr:P1 family peptidase [Acidobacteriota bacterium]
MSHGRRGGVESWECLQGCWIPVGRQLRADAADARGGSIMIVVATDAPAGARNLKRLAARSFFGLARTGASGSNGSGDYAIAFSTSRRPAARLGNDQMSPLFIAVAEATEEAVYNSLFRAATVTSNGRTVEALPLGRVLEILRYHKIVR